MESLQTLKRKIKSVKKTSKITEAMKLVSIVKLKKQRDVLNNIEEYYNEFYNIVSAIVNSVNDLKFLEVKNAKKATLYIVINSSLGLCGAYNNNVNKLIVQNIDVSDSLFLIGKKSFSYYKNHEFTSQIFKQIDIADNNINLENIQAIGKFVLDEYLKGNVNKVVVCYTKFVNAMTFKPTLVSLLPIDKQLLQKKNASQSNMGVVQFLPNEKDLLNSLIPHYLNTFLYGAVTESKVCEFASRRNAMDMATNNANDLQEKYRLQFNKMRQAKITQEISEIMAGSNN